jgi:putative flippase GtrA
MAAGTAKLRSVAHELTKFGTIGVLALVVNAVATNVAWKLMPGSKLTGSIIGTVIATVVSYIGNRYWTYKDRDSIGKHRELVLFAVVNAIGMLIESMPLAVTAYVLDMNNSILAANIAKYLFGVPLAMVFRLWTYRTWIFPKVDLAVADTQYQYDAGQPLPTSQLPTSTAAAMNGRHRRSGSGELMFPGGGR